jgi:wyosine [tRNA(Phe)-imidazoG37] synthetase (radical SAM superfamily)
MVYFSKQYNGKFIFEVTFIKGYNDDEASVQRLKEIIEEISPDKVVVARIEDEIFKKKLGITDERFKEILNDIVNNKTNQFHSQQ